jgi:hypothetical protein
MSNTVYISIFTIAVSTYIVILSRKISAMLSKSKLAGKAAKLKKQIDKNLLSLYL